MKKLLVAGISFAAFCSTPAFAADMPVKAPVYKAVEAYNWTGWYGGYNVGVGVSQTLGNGIAGIGGSFDRGGAGFAGGVQGGYNWQLDPHWVAGIEGDIGYLGINRSFEDLFDDNISFGVKTDWYSTLRGRLGYSSGASLFYATGGVAYVNLRNNFDNAVGDSSAAKKTTNGWTAGGGIETMLGGNWSAKAEYLYIDAGSQDVFNSNGNTVRFDNRFHIFRYGLNYKFGGSSVPVSLMPSHKWSGFYAGVNVGAGLSQDHATAPGTVGALDIAGAGFIGGVQAGYNWQINPSWVVGVEGDFGFLGIKHSFLSWDDIIALGVKPDWLGTIRGRLGYSTGPALLYVTGGAAFVSVKNNLDDPGVSAFATKSEVATGWTVGGGIEATLTQNWTAKTEYLYVDVGSQDVFNPGSAQTSIAHFDNRFHVFKFGLNYKFGG